MGSPSQPSSGRFKDRGLYRLLVVLAVLGVLLPATTLVLKAAAEDFHLWSNWREADPARARFLAEHPRLDIERSLPFLARLAWHDPRETPFLAVYATHAALNGLVLVGLLAFRRRLVRRLDACASWLNGRTHRRARLTTFAFAATILASYQLETSLGFWFPGIGGWTYADWSATRRAELSTEDDPDPAGGREPTAEERAFLEQAVAFENAKLLPGPGYVSGRALFLHYAGGEVLPGSYELTDMVFPHYVFGGKHVRVDDPETFGTVLRNALAYRREGGRFLLPLSLSYPNHAVYAPIDYADYPDPATLERVTFWRLTLRIDDDLTARLVTALQHYSVDV